MKKNETILIRLNSELKDSFRKVCEENDLSMTDVLISQIKDIVTNYKSKNENSDYSIIVQERDFYKKELEIFQKTFYNIDKTIKTYKDHTSKKRTTLYLELIQRSFNIFKEFKDFKLIKDEKKINGADFIAKHELLNEIIIIHVTHAIDNLAIGPRRNYYRKLCTEYKNRYKNDYKIKLIIIQFDNLELNNDYYSEKLSEIIGYETKVINFDDLL